MKNVVLLLLAIALLPTCRNNMNAPVVSPVANGPVTTGDVSPYKPKFIIDKSGLYNGQKMGVQAGDTVGILTGDYANLILERFVGIPGRPIVFLNYKGRVAIRGTTQNSGNLSINGCSHFVLSGSGVAAIRYGFNVSSAYRDVSALVVSGKSTNCEISQVEVSQSGFAGMMIKTDPLAKDPSTWLGSFVMSAVTIHDNYVHDTLGEGLYIGNSFWNSGQNGLYPHEIYGLDVHHNVIERSGAEGIQYSCAPGARVHHNRVVNTGINPFASHQNAGVQISGGSSGEFYANTIDSARGVGLIIVGAIRKGDSLLIQNVLITHSNIFAGDDKLRAETCAVFIDNRSSPPGIGIGGKLTFQNVTVDGARLDGIRLYNETQSNVIRKSIIRGYKRSAFDRSPQTVSLTEQDNFTGLGLVQQGIGYQGQ